MISGVVILFLLAILKKSYNISIHMAAFGAYLGTIFAIAKIQGNISSDFIALVFIIGGILGSSRAYLKRYTPGEIITGAMLGFVWCYFLAIILNTI
jgi:membrane-associated phospholipid phosphatase